MTAQEFHQQVLARLEFELSGVGCIVDGDYREQLARVLDRIDQVTTREDAEALYAEVGHELRDPNAPVVCSPAVWLRAVECA